ncbi:hypothetical protein EW093_04945 [Thiospirochaeta perfilievii]|uniref:Uncharacterized protein n=1 Tax=Thiospirochaeta perfilievii TaxID=252967 RepID=A0A5C1QCZ1_9SPIO|nr:hypothetical protein [Thiospirochaeta perfilievii]QEN04072.1 hypothetical protein EW093_04945 [Thiospirochaeta perfilievii]
MKIINKRALSILLLLLTTIMLTSATKSPYYAKSVVITKVFPHSKGYKVYYLTNDLNTKEAYLPSYLFEEQKDDTRERSKLFQGYDKAFPYMTIFWKDGEFSHVKLYLKSDYGDPTWGVFTNQSDQDEFFENADLKFDF